VPHTSPTCCPLTLNQTLPFKGEYIKTWCPELSKLPPPKLFEPWNMSKSESEKYGIVLGEDYPDFTRNHAGMGPLSGGNPSKGYRGSEGRGGRGGHGAGKGSGGGKGGGKGKGGGNNKREERMDRQKQRKAGKAQKMSDFDRFS